MQRPLVAAYLLCLLATLLAPGISAQGRPIGFAEQWALATDRSKALEQLIPGTRDYYYYHCRHKQDVGQFGGVEPLLRAWIQRYGRTARVQQIENRQALLTFDKDPAQTLQFLQERLGLKFDHQRQIAGARRDIPSTLDPQLVSTSAFTRRALQRHRGSAQGFKPSAFDALLASDLDDDLLMSVLTRLQRPDVTNLPALIVKNLRHRRSRGFGSLGIHQRLLRDQLEECVRLMPKLLNDQKFVQVYLARLRPGADADVAAPGVRREYLDRLHRFAQRLSSAHNSLKAHVLHHRLRFDLRAGKPDKARFLAYMRLPRAGSYVNPEFIRRHRRAGGFVDTNRAYPTGLSRIGNDEPLVRSYLMHFFSTEDSYQAYGETIRTDYLRKLFAETKILLGQGDMERWYSLLDDPAYYERLKERVELAFLPSLRQRYGANDAVELELDVKNVKTLLVKVFEINTFNYYQKMNREVDASISLDGLVANHETTHEYDESPMRRVRRKFSFPSLTKPGVFVVEFIGNGISSRAVIHKGRLQYTQRLGAAGHVLTVRDESGAKLENTAIWFGGRNYVADEDGEIALPYSTQPGQRPIILRHGELSSLEQLQHQSESYELTAGIHLDRESLIAGQKAKILVRPKLRLNGNSVGVSVLEDPVLTIQSRDSEGVPSTMDVRGFPLFDDKESVHEIQVPEGLAVLSVTLRGRVQNLSQGKPVQVTTGTATFQVNTIDATPLTACPLLGRTSTGYVLDVLGKNGEPKPQRAVRLVLTHEDFTDSYTVTLKTDANGRIRLGALAGITHVMATGLPKNVGYWQLRTNHRTYPSQLHGVSGATLRVPYSGNARVLSRSIVSLLERRGGVYVRDAFDRVALADGFLELRDLAPGDYSLWLKEARRSIDVRVTNGRAADGWAIGGTRMLETAGGRLLHIADVSVANDALRVQLANAGPDARVHVVATRYLAPFDPFEGLQVTDAMTGGIVDIVHPETTYHSGREIGDEYRYILDRRFAKKFPGNMLSRPGILLNPWALDERATTAVGMGGGAGGKWGGRRGGLARKQSKREAGGGRRRGRAPGTFANLEFLPEPATVISNLRADAQGRVTVPLAQLGSGQLVHVVAVDTDDTVYASTERPETELVAKSRQLQKALDAEQHFAERRKIEFVQTGGKAVLGDATRTKAESYDSLASVFRLFSTLSGDADLAQFAFVLEWPKLKLAEKHARYEKHACHELHFFLHEKDPAYFQRYIRPYLANKSEKTFLDRWLLEEDLSSFLEPWAFGRLNIVERILLARRLAQRSPSIRRHIRELFELTNRDPERLARLFDGALKSGALEEGKGALAGKLAELQKNAAPTPSKKAPSLRRGRGGRAAGRPAPKPADKAKVSADREVVEEELEEDAAADAKPGAATRGILAKRLKDLRRRENTKELYRAPDPTRPFVEHNYWHRRNHEHVASLIGVNGFWADFAVAPADQPFVSTHLAEATSNFAEMMLALAVLDLPFEPGDHTTSVDGTELTFTAKSPLLLVRKELVQAAADPAQKRPILVSQNYYRLDEPYRYEGNERLDAYVTGEFLVDVAYGCRVVVTNPTSTPRKLELLLQIPEGSVPVNGGFYTKGRSVSLPAYGTKSIEYAFYFPAAGTVPHYPVHVASGGKLVAYAESGELAVLEEATKVDRTSWQHVSQNGDPATVIAYLEKANLQRTDLGKIAWRMRDAGFFAKVVGLLRQRHVYSDVVWSYGIRHGKADVVREYLRHQDDFLRRCGTALESRLVSIDPVERHVYQHVEYDPLFNARAHRFGKQRRILNDHFARQYQAFLQVMGDLRVLADADWMSVTYYLLLQDRIEEALASFARVRPSSLPMRVQYDYMQAYLDLFTEGTTKARRIADQYAEFPVLRWRKLFAEVGNQLDEVEGEAVGQTDPESRTQRQTALAAAAPALELEVESRRVALRYKNLEQCEVRYYEMDVEFLFSTHPFVQQGAGSFAFIKPNKRERRTLPKGQAELAFDLPKELQNSNVLIEVEAGGVTRRQAYYANSLAVQWTESYGQLRVAHKATGRPLKTVYVKVFKRESGGKVRFYKDGYTDLRGRFDYASLSAKGTPAERYSILVLSEEHGAVIREVTPPVQ